MKRGAHGRDIWGLVAIFVIFLAASYALERVSQQTVGRDVPSSLNAQAKGAKALFLLMSRLGYSTNRFDRSWLQLPAKPALLVVTEPLSPDREVSKEEEQSLTSWVKAGGSVLYYAVGNRPRNTIFGIPVTEVGAKTAPAVVAPINPQSPYVRGISELSVDSLIRLSDDHSPGSEVLVRDAGGVIVLHKHIGAGDVVIVANSTAVANNGIAQADNVLLAVDTVVATAQQTGGRVLFDEYHHGLGFDTADSAQDGTDGLMAATPLPLRLGFYDVIALSLLIIYNGNRRFGLPRTVARPKFKASTDYVGSMARLLKRAHAGDVAVLALYRRFVRDLRSSLQISPDWPAAELPELAARSRQVSLQSITDLITTCERVEAGWRPGEAETTAIAMAIENMRRSCNLVGVE